MKPIYNFLLLTLVLFTGCQLEPQAPKKDVTLSIEELQDAHYKVDKQGDVVLQTEYEHFDKDTNTTKKILKQENITKQKGYERVPVFDKGYKKQLSLKGKKHKIFSVKGGKVKVSVESIPLNEFIDLTLGSVLKLNYTLNEDVKKMNNAVTLNMTEPQKSSKFFKVVKKILLLNGVSIKDENGLLFIYKSNQSNSKTIANDVYIGYGRSIPKYLDDEKDVMLFVPYNYIKPNLAATIVHQSGINNIKFYYLIDGIQTIKAKAEVARKALKIINLIDKPYLEGKTPYLINLNNIEVDEFIPKIEQIFLLNGINIVKMPSQGGIVMMPIKELNSLYIITPKKEWLDMLLYWKKKLDVDSEAEEEPQLYIYHVKNRKADELATAVKEVLGLTKTKHTTDMTKKKSVAGEIKNKKTTLTEKESVSNAFLISRVNYTPTVTADLDTNILMMKLTPKHYKVILSFIKELDRLPLQTLVEVTVAEVDMTDTFSLGFEYAIRNKGLGIDHLLNVSGGGSGLGIVFKSDKIDATVNAFAEKKLLDIVSKPKLLILNNSTGSINVGTQIPIITSETSATDISSGITPSINRNISYRTTGINVGLTPTINSNGVLTMQININLSEAQLNDTSGIDSPLIVNRELSTAAVIHSGDTILIGGLISHNKSRTKGGIPYLKDIPYIGGIFAAQSHKTTKTELIMLIHPVIIQTPQSLNNETKRFKTLLDYINLDDL